MSKLPFAWLLLACASAGCTPQGFGTTSFTTGSYLDQGVAQYGGKPLLGTAGEFLNLVVSPSGKQVAFVGRESNVAYELFVGDVGGAIRKVAATGQAPTLLQWSNDEQRLFFRALDAFPPGQPLAVGQTPTGEAIHVVSVADGQDRKVSDVAGQSSAFPSPDLARVALFGWTDAAKSGDWGKLIDVADDQRTRLVTGFWEFARATWNPSGTWMWIADGKTLARYDAPTWKRGLELPLEHPGQASWQPDGKTLRFYAAEPSSADGKYRFRIAGVREDGTFEDTTAVPLEAPPPGFEYSYETVFPCPDGKRVLIHRRAFSHYDNNVISEDGRPPSPPPGQPPDANLLMDIEAGRIGLVAPGVTPLGWLDAGRALAYTGRANAQDKVLSVVTL